MQHHWSTFLQEKYSKERLATTMHFKPRSGTIIQIPIKIYCDAMMHVLKDSTNLKYSELLIEVISKCNLI